MTTFIVIHDSTLVAALAVLVSCAVSISSMVILIITRLMTTLSRYTLKSAKIDLPYLGADLFCRSSGLRDGSGGLFALPSWFRDMCLLLVQS